ncbi:ATP-binding protein, partial [Streptomyces alkaliterrae]
MTCADADSEDSADPARRAFATPGAPPGDSFAVWTLDHGSRSPGIARGFARTALCGWGLDDLVDSVAVAVSEMVTNAMCHAGGPWRTAGGTPVLLSLSRRGDSVLCVVVDAGTSAPAVREAGDWAESGRGLHIVECLSNDWGWTPPGPEGKAVWACFSPEGSEPHTCGHEVEQASLSRVLTLAAMLADGDWPV